MSHILIFTTRTTHGGNWMLEHGLGKGVVAMVVRDDLEDAAIANCQRNLRDIVNDVHNNPVYDRTGYTAVEVNRDYAYLREGEGNRNLPVGDLHTKKIPAKERGAPAEIGLPAGIKRGKATTALGEPFPAENIVHLGPDSDPTHPLYGGGGKPTGVDAMGEQNMFNIVWDSNGLENKFSEETKLVTRINNAWDAYALDQASPTPKMPAGMRYKFAYAEQVPDRPDFPPSWKPVGDDGVTLAPLVQAVNAKLSAARQLKVEDFVLVSLATQ